MSQLPHVYIGVPKAPETALQFNLTTCCPSSTYPCDILLPARPPASKTSQTPRTDGRTTPASSTNSSMLPPDLTLTTYSCKRKLHSLPTRTSLATKLPWPPNLSSSITRITMSRSRTIFLSTKARSTAWLIYYMIWPITSMYLMSSSSIAIVALRVLPAINKYFLAASQAVGIAVILTTSRPLACQ